MIEEKKEENYSYLEDSPQPEKAKKKVAEVAQIRHPVALKTCNVQLEDCLVELVEGQPVAGLTRQERDHLTFHNFIQ